MLDNMQKDEVQPIRQMKHISIITETYPEMISHIVKEMKMT